MSLSTALTYQPKEITTQPSFLRKYFQKDAIPDEVVLKKALEECHATSLSFVDMFLSQESMMILAESLPGHSETLRHLSLSRCGARGSSVISIFSNLSLCRNLMTLHLASCGLTATNMYSLCNTVLRGCIQLKELDVSDNPLKDEGVHVLTMLLTHETSPIQLTSLGLSSVLATDGLRLAQMLMKIPSLTNVDVSGNPIDTRDPEVRAAMLALDRTLRRQWVDIRGGSSSGKNIWTPPDSSEHPHARISSRSDDINDFEPAPSQSRQFSSNSKPTASPSIAPGGRGVDSTTRPLRLLKVDKEKQRSISVQGSNRMNNNITSISPRLFATQAQDTIKRLGLPIHGYNAYPQLVANKPRSVRGLSNSPTRRGTVGPMNQAQSNMESRTPPRKPPVPVLSSPRRHSTTAGEQESRSGRRCRRAILVNATPRYCFGKRVADLSSHPSPAFVQPMHPPVAKVKCATADCTLSYAYDDPRDVGYRARHGNEVVKQPSAVFRYSEKRCFGLTLAATPGPGAYHNPALISSITKRGISPTRLNPNSHSFGRSQRVFTVNQDAIAVPGPGAYDTHTF